MVGNGQADEAFGFMAGGGEAGEAARAVDWAETPLGPVAGWPQSLRSAVGLVLRSQHPMLLVWGPSLVQFYNDAYIPTLSEGMHPSAMGQDARVCFRALWHRMGPQVEAVMNEGRSLMHEDRLGQTARHGELEEAYWTYSFSPVLDERGRVAAALVICHETTARVIATRRARLLGMLAERLSKTASFEEVAQGAVDVLASFPADFPYVARYMLDGDGPRLAELVPRTNAFAEAVHGAILPLVGQAGRTRAHATLIEHAPLEDLPDAVWPEAVRHAIVSDLSDGTAGAREVWVFGKSPRLAYDASQHELVQHVVSQIADAQRRVLSLQVDEVITSERRSLLRQAPVPMAIFRGPEHVCELVNDAFSRMVHGRMVEGARVFDCFPELTTGPLRSVLDVVYQKGERISVKEFYAPIDRGQGPSDSWFQFSLEPLREKHGGVYGMVVVAVDISEAVASRRSLEKLYHEREKLLSDLEAAHRAKDEFLAMLSHELRNPLAPIVTAVNLMHMKEAPGLERERDIIERQARHLVRLVDDLLDVARITKGKVTLEPRQVVLHEVITTAIEMASPLLEERAHHLTVDVARKGLDVLGDPQRLAQVFSNLIGNAAKYTPPRGNIAVRAHERGELVEVEIQDDGQGVDPAQLPHLFEAFYQSPQARDRTLGGLGLGLAVVKNLITLHGGSVTVQSDGVGLGSTFTVSLKRMPSSETLVSERPQLTPVPAGPPSQRVLLVDDNEDLVELYSIVLLREGYLVETAFDGPSALEVAARFRPHIAVLDLGLPVMDGFELARRLRDGPSPPRLIALSGYGQESDRAKGRAAGFTTHLVKPVDAHRLLITLRGDTR